MDRKKREPSAIMLRRSSRERVLFIGTQFSILYTYLNLKYPPMDLPQDNAALVVVKQLQTARALNRDMGVSQTSCHKEVILGRNSVFRVFSLYLWLSDPCSMLE